MLEPLFWMMVGHAVGDFGLQSDWMAKHKNRRVHEDNVHSRKPELIWAHVMSSHCLIHAGAVGLATGSVLLAVMEFVAHFIIDVCKCEGYIGFHTDQFLHIGCKLAWWGLLVTGMVSV